MAALPIAVEAPNTMMVSAGNDPLLLSVPVDPYESLDPPNAEIELIFGAGVPADLAPVDFNLGDSGTTVSFEVQVIHSDQFDSVKRTVTETIAVTGATMQEVIDATPGTYAGTATTMVFPALRAGDTFEVLLLDISVQEGLNPSQSIAIPVSAVTFLVGGSVRYGLA